MKMQKVRKIGKLRTMILLKELLNTSKVDLGNRYQQSPSENENICEIDKKICGSCGGTQDLKRFKDKWVCQSCIDEVKEIMSNWNSDDLIL